MAIQVAPPTPTPTPSLTPRSQSGVTHNACEHLRVHFIENLQRADLQRLLGAINARVITGPGQGGEYTLATPRPNETLYELQLHPAVIQAETTGC